MNTNTFLTCRENFSLLRVAPYCLICSEYLRQGVKNYLMGALKISLNRNLVLN